MQFPDLAAPLHIYLEQCRQLYGWKDKKSEIPKKDETQEAVSIETDFKKLSIEEKV